MEQNTQPLRPFVGAEPPWTWCAQCQRAHVHGSARIVQFASDALHPHPATLSLCPYFDCGVGTARHGWRWMTIQREHPDYPVTPKQGVIYAR